MNVPALAAPQPARGVQAQHDELRLVAGGALQPAAHEIRARRADRALERHDEHRRRRGKRRPSAQHSGEKIESHAVKQEQLPGDAIVIRGARQNNLKNLSLAIPTGEPVVGTGVSGPRKSSLVFDTLYAEGQRDNVKTCIPDALQFSDRMARLNVDAV